MFKFLLAGFAVNLIYFWFINRNNCVDRFIRKMKGQPADFWTWKRLSEAGEADATTKDADTTPKFSPEQQKAVDHIVEARLARERAAKADYDELKQFKEAALKEKDAAAQKELEARKQYDEAKKGLEAQIGQHKDIISKKDQEITDLKIGHSLTNEISKQNGFIEETIALLKSSAVLIDGQVFIKTKDANNIDVQLPVGEGVKRFLEAKPHLVKANFKPGAGGSGTTQTTGGAGQEETLIELNAKLLQAQSRGDKKASAEISQKIKAKLQAGK